MRFSDFLKTTVLLSAGSATLLAVITVLTATRDIEDAVIFVSAGWWVLATLLGLQMGRRAEATPPIARLLADARSQTMLPEQRPAQTVINRLWPLLVMTLAAGIIGLFIPQVAGLAAGFAIVWALAWRRQHLAVAAIEERDAARFYIDHTSPLAPMKLIRTPGFGGKFLRVEP